MNFKLKCVALASVLSISAYGASIDHIQTYTPEYLGNQAQNGAINGVSVYYNPAGTTQLEEGLYVNGGLQIAAGHEMSVYNGKESKAIFVQPVPNIAITKVNKGESTYFNFGAIAGGGTLNYKDGVSGTAMIPDLVPMLAADKQVLNIDMKVKEGTYAKGSSLYSQMTLGKAYQIDDKLSLSGGIRLVHGRRTLEGKLGLQPSPKLISNKSLFNSYSSILKQKAKGANFDATIDSKREAVGYGFVLGANYRASEKWNLGMRYDSRVKLNFKSKTSEKEITVPALPNFAAMGFTSDLYYPEYKDGNKQRRDLPAILAVGTTYQVTDKWMTGLSANYYFNKDAKMDGVRYSNGWEIAFGNEYKLNEKWTVLGSMNYAKTGAAKNTYNDVEFALDSFMLGTGVKYQYSPTLELTATVAHYFYNGKDGNLRGRVQERASETIKKISAVKEDGHYKKSITAFGLGFTKKF